MTTIAELAEDRTVEGVFAVTRKERRRTRAGAPYLALELADASGRIEARVWNDVELLDQRFAEGDAVRVLGRVERFGGKLQVQVRAVEPAEDADPAALDAGAAPRRGRARRLPRVPRRRRSRTPGSRRSSTRSSRDAEIRAALRALPGGGRRRPPRLRGRAPRAHGRRRDALPRDGAAPPAPARATSSSPRRSCTTSAACASSGAARRSGRPRKDACSATSTSGCA